MKKFIIYPKNKVNSSQNITSSRKHQYSDNINQQLKIIEDALHDFERAQLVYETAQIFMHKLMLPCAKTKKKKQEVLEIPKEFDDYLTEGEEKCKEV